MIKIEDIISIYKNIGDNKNKHLSWRITNNCNYRCEYCSQGLNKKSDNNQEKLNADAEIIKNIIIKTKQKINFSFFGGEPSIFDLPKLVTIIDNKYISNYSTITNLSRDESYYKKLYNEINNRNKKLKIIASLHETQCNYKEFLNKALNLYNYGINIRIEIVIGSNNLDFCKNIISYMNNNNFDDFLFSIERDINNKISCSEASVKFANDYMKNKSSWKLFLETKNGTKKMSFQEIINDCEDKILLTNGWSCQQSKVRIEPDGIIRTVCEYNDCNKYSIYDNNCIIKFDQIGKCLNTSGCNLCSVYNIKNIVN